MLASGLMEELGGGVVYVVLFVLMAMGVAWLRGWWLRRTLPSPESQRAAVSKLRRMQAEGASYKECSEYLRQMGYKQEIADRMIGEATAKKEASRTGGGRGGAG